MEYDMSETIAAMATAPGESGIGIIRISGTAATRVADAVFKSASGRLPSGFRNFTMRFGWVVRRVAGGRDEVVDEALLTVMRAPRSYTREDSVEISCHGGTVAMRAVLELVLENGCRLAEPGEFTKRAFLNGRIDLAQAEAVLDVIKAKTDAALRVGIGQLQGELSRRLDRIRKHLVAVCAVLESSIDFPDEGGHAGTPADLRPRLRVAAAELRQLLEGAARGRAYREGISAVICGKPNTGKSSLLNALLKEERSIVTPVAGTTRDAVEDIIDIKGIPVRIIDTAGILKPRDLVEKKAMEKTRQRIAAADLVILVFDGSKRLDGQDRSLLRRFAGRKTIAVINKIDLACRIEAGHIRERLGEPVGISAKKASNIGLLEDEIARVAAGAGQQGDVLVGNIRHIQQLKKIKKIIDETLKYRDNEVPVECLAQNLKDASLLLDRLQGKSFSDDLLERIFHQFCIGK